MKFELLADSIKQINDKASSAAKSAVNQLMTLRNWAIGYYIRWQRQSRIWFSSFEKFGKTN